MHCDASFSCDRGNLGDRLNHTQLIARVHHANDFRVEPYGAPNRIGVNDATSVDRYLSDRTQPGAGSKHGGMLNRSRNRVAAARDSEQRQIICFRAAAGEDDFVSALRRQHRCDHPPRFVQFLPRRLTEIMDTGSVAEHLGHYRQHCFEHLGAHGRSRVVVEIITVHGRLIQF